MLIACYANCAIPIVIGCQISMVIVILELWAVSFWVKVLSDLYLNQLWFWKLWAESFWVNVG